jgi:predicted heme/steroid binding protein
MSPPVADLAPPKASAPKYSPISRLTVPQSDPITPSQLAQYDGSDPSKPIYVAIKGRVFDVSGKKEMYGKGAGYNVFAGKDASKGLGMSSLDPKDAVSDYSSLNEAQIKTLDQWEGFFEKVREPQLTRLTPALQRRWQGRCGIGSTLALRGIAKQMLAVPSQNPSPYAFTFHLHRSV